MTTYSDTSGDLSLEEVSCIKCGMRVLEAHLARCPKCAMPLGPATKLLSSPLGGRPWANVEDRKARVIDGSGDLTAPRVTFTMTAGSQRGKTFSVSNHQVLLMGRCPKNDIPVDDEFASWHHMLLEINAPWVFLRDLGSLNGVYVNRVRIGGGLHGDGDSTPLSGGVRLRDGDAIAAGMNGMAVRLDNMDTEFAGRAPLPEYPDVPGYRLHHPLPDQGIGRAFRATRAADNTPVIVRILNPAQPVHPPFVAPLLHHIEELRSLRFPHLTRIHDAGVHDGWCWIVTKFKTGDSGKLARSRGGRLSWELLVPILLQALKGLAFAHNMGFLHHDLRPTSILIRKEKQSRFVQIRDIGIASLVDQFRLQPIIFTGDDVRPLDFTPRERITRFRKRLPASDVWSIAACAYFLLTGHAPRDAQPGGDPICTALENDAVPILERRIDMPTTVAAIIDTALAADPTNRFCDAEAFRDALKSVARKLDVKSSDSE